MFVMAPLRGAKRRKKAAAEKKAAMAAAAAGQGAPGGDWWDGFCMRMAGASLFGARGRTSRRDLFVQILCLASICFLSFCHVT